MNQRVNAPESLRRGQGSGPHQGLRRPNDDQRVAQALHEVGLEDQGEVVEDQLRDRRSSGLPIAGESENNNAG